MLFNTFQCQIYYNNKNKCKIINDKGSIIFEDKNFDILNTYKDQMNYFIQHLKNKTIPMNTLEESINALKITLVNE